MGLPFTADLEDIASAAAKLGLRTQIDTLVVPRVCIRGDDLAYYACVYALTDGSYDFKFYMDGWRSIRDNGIYERVTRAFGPGVRMSYDDYSAHDIWSVSVGAMDRAKELLRVAAPYMRVSA